MLRKKGIRAKRQRRIGALPCTRLKNGGNVMGKRGLKAGIAGTERSHLPANSGRMAKMYGRKSLVPSESRCLFLKSDVHIHAHSRTSTQLVEAESHPPPCSRLRWISSLPIAAKWFSQESNARRWGASKSTPELLLFAQKFKQLRFIPGWEEAEPSRLPDFPAFCREVPSSSSIKLILRPDFYSRFIPVQKLRQFLCRQIDMPQLGIAPTV